MVVSFGKYLKRKQDRENYRQLLVEKILHYMHSHPEEAAPNSLYLDHVKDGFPLNILENIVHRIERKASNE